MDDQIYIGSRPAWEGERPFGLFERDLAQHLWVIGRSGSGKSTLLRNLAIQHLDANRGLGVIDPHGDLADALLDEIPPARMDQVVVFDPSDLAHPVGLNLLAAVPRDGRPLVTSNIVSVFRHLWAESWGPRSEYILTNAIAALLDCPPSMGATLLGVPRLFVDDAYRQRVVGQIENAKVRSFWLDEYEGWDQRFRSEAVAPIQNKAGALLTNPVLRNVLGQVKRRFDPAVTLDRGQVLIANLSKGKLGEAESSLLGALLVTALHLAALGRARQREKNRRPFHLIIDEFQSFSTDSLASILAEARKYGLSVTLAHQYVGQLREEVRLAVFGNVGTALAFRIGAQDVPLLEREFTPISRQALLELSAYQVCAKLMQHGEVSDPFIGRTLPPLTLGHGRGELVRDRSRRRFARPRDEVEGKIGRWLSP